jgi:type VI secretion system protein ImpH
VSDPQPLADRLLDEPYAFDFFQAVRLLGWMYPGREPVGYDADPGQELVRFRAEQSLAFPASDIADITAPSQSPSGQAELTVEFMGLTGPMGTLPRHYTAHLADRSARQTTAALKDFLDLFNHRFISFFYRAWEKYRFPIAYERGQSDRFSVYLMSLVGLGTAGLQKRLSFADDVLLYYSGLLSQRPRSAAALQQILADYFEAPITIEQFTGEWFLMNADALSSLGGENSQLGVSAALWQEVFDPQARFRVVVGPLPWRQFREFLPDGSGYRDLLELTRFVAGDDMNFEVQPLIETPDVPPCALGVDSGVRLGWAMWLAPHEEAAISYPVFAAHVPNAANPQGTHQ